ncbi:MAG: TonB-dependent receptor domain-containing protein [Bryobacteraceae bacterium]
MTAGIGRAFALAACLCAGAVAQEFRATLTGRIIDPSGAPVPAAAVAVRNVQTNEEFTATAGGDGNFTVPFLMPGKYRVTVEAAGFKRGVREGIELHVSDRAALSIALELGEMQQAVTVTAEAPLLETASATRGQLIENRRVTELPLNARNPFMLSALAAGVQWNGSMKYARPFDNGAIAEWSINGGLPRHNEFLLDGAPNNAVTNADDGRTRSTNNIAFVPPVDATEEFKIMANTYDAQYGRTGGGIVNVSLKAGANQFHGAGYEFLRRYWMDANSFENNAAGLMRYAIDPKTGDNLGGHLLDQYGAHLSGPVRLPRYNGKDRTFFMFNFEGYREGTPNPAISSVPSMLERKGDFSQAGITVWDPVTSRENPAFDPGKAEGAGNPRYVRDQFPGNRIPASRLNPAGSKIAGSYPEPNTGGDGARFNNFLLSPNIARDQFRSWIGRVDHYYSPGQRMYFRYLHNRRNELRNINSLTGLGMSAQDPAVRINDGGVVDSVTTLSPTTILNLRGALNRYIMGAYRQQAMGFDLTTLGLPAALAKAIPQAMVPRISAQQYKDWGPAAWTEEITNTLSFQGSLSRVSGKHSLKAGGEMRDLRANLKGSGWGGGRFTFDREFTRRLPQYSDNNSGSAIASLLLGYPSGGTVENNAFPAFRWGYYAVYVQDDIRAGAKLTLNLGLRYDYESAPTERYDRMNRGFAFGQTNPLSARIRPAAECPACANLRGGLLFAAAAGAPRAAFDPDRNNFQPRIGAAYQLDSRTVLRGGYGLYTMAQAEFGGSTGFSISTPYVAATGGGAASFIPSNSLSNPFPSGLLSPVGSSQGLLTQAGQELIFNLPTRRIPNVHQFSFGVQRELPWRMKVDASYVGSRARGLMTNEFRSGAGHGINANTVEQLARARQDSRWYTQAVANPFAGLLPGTSLNSATVARSQLLRPYPQFLGITQGLENVGRTWYNSFQLVLEKRFGNGLTFTSSYTLSKNIGALDYLNDQDPGPSRVLLDSDRTHRWVLSGVYEMPFGKGRKFGGGSGRAVNLLLGGWQFNWIATLQSGDPMVYPGAANLVGNPRVESQSLSRWFNPCVLQLDGASREPNAARTGFVPCSQPAWAIRAPYTLRTTPQRSGQMRNFWASQYDMSLSKMFRINERMRAQFRVESFNTFNTPIFGGPNTDPASPLFGNVTAAQVNFPRFVQLGFKFVF